MGDGRRVLPAEPEPAANARSKPSVTSASRTLGDELGPVIAEALQQGQQRGVGAPGNLDHSDIFIGLYWERSGRVGPGKAC